MAVYTEVDDTILTEFLLRYDIGTVVSFAGIAEGVENSNYLLRTTKAHYILTLYEKRVNADDLPFFVELMEHLASKGMNCPLPVAAKD
ncbi:MAG: phosphotransferase, partial [Candidatus Puniceispirillum sp.]